MKYLLTLLMLTTSATAWDLGQYEGVDPQTRAWFRSVVSPLGVPCCDMADGHQVQWETTPEGYRVFVEDAWRDVPKDAVVTKFGNPTGNAVVWYVKQAPDGIHIRCFVPGALL
jgi:hypothetical protein